VRHDDHFAELIHRVFCSIFCPCGHHRRITRDVAYSFKGVVFKSEGDIMLTVKDTDVPGTVHVTIAYKDAKGRAAKVDGVPTWSTDNASVIDSITPAADGMTADLHITDNTGAAQLTIDADADLGAGTVSLQSVDVVSVIPSDAVAADITFGAVTPDTPTP
jgi:hypothetical protein